MKTFLILIGFFFSCATIPQTARQELPGWMKGRFADDYGIRYTINDSLFVMEGSAKYHILQWNEKEQYLLTQNDSMNKTDAGLFTRLDYMKLEDMKPFDWGYCFTMYNAKDTATALQAMAADRANPRKGCNGYPFSRMKRAD
ncbi:MAG: hypothetical protein EOO10_17675 [Chitinophagaceae bacterium]|nr:MAG: hypothetical protein EOO10_17675 [Chitinophagaceae bacterium]